MSSDTHVYIGTLPCGCHVAVCVDMQEMPKATAKSVSDMIMNGYQVSRYALKDLHDGTVKIHSCHHKEQGTGS